jgi:hypothetical protein
VVKVGALGGEPGKRGHDVVATSHVSTIR